MLFISHGEREPWVSDLRRSLVALLREQGFCPRVDDEHLASQSDQWPDTLDDWITGCRAAVIILDKRAQERPWCWAEISHLMLRKRLEDLPVVLIDCGLDHAGLHPFLRDTTRVLEAQMVTVAEKEPINEVLQAVLNRLGPPSRLSTESIRGEYVSKVFDLLRKMDTSVLRQAALDLGKQDELHKWGFPRALPARLAEWLLDGELQTVAAALCGLPGLSLENRRDVLLWSAIFKIDYETVKSLPHIASGASNSHRAFRLRMPSCDETADWQIKRPFRPGRVRSVSLPCNSAAAIEGDMAVQLQSLIETHTHIDGNLDLAMKQWNKAFTRFVFVDGKDGRAETAAALADEFKPIPICITNGPELPGLPSVGVDWDETTTKINASDYRMARDALES